MHNAERRAVLCCDGTGAVAVCAALRCGALFAAGALADVAGFDARYGHIFFAAEGRLFKGDCDLSLDAFAFTRCISAARGGAAASENGAEDIAKVEIHPAEAAETAEARAAAEVRIDACVAVLVVFGPLVGVGQDLVCLVDLLEARFRVLIPLVDVRMVFLCVLPKRFFDLVVGSAFTQPQDLVIVPFVGHVKRPLPAYQSWSTAKNLRTFAEILR